MTTVRRAFTLVNEMEVLTDMQHPSIVFIAMKHGEKWVAMPVPAKDIPDFLESITHAVHATTTTITGSC